MTGNAARYLYLARHGEASDDESELSARGRRQAELLGEPAAPGPPVGDPPRPSAPGGPDGPGRSTMSRRRTRSSRANPPGTMCLTFRPGTSCRPRSADAVLQRLAQFPKVEREAGPWLARAAPRAVHRPVDGDRPRHELVARTTSSSPGWCVPL